MEPLPNEISGPSKVIFYTAIVSVVVIFISDLTKWPPLLKGWEGDNHRFIQDIRFGIPSILFLLIIAAWMYKHRRFYVQFKKDFMQLLFLFFALFYLPVTGLLILAITSAGFAHSPRDNEASMKLYTVLDNIQFFIFIGAAIVCLLYYLNKRSIPRITNGKE